MSEIIGLNGGLRLAYMNIPYVHSVSVGVFVKTGSRDEILEKNGIAHFTEHVMFKGTERRSAFQIVSETDALGANVNAFTSKEMTAYYFQCIDDTVDACADVLSDILLHSVFPAEELEKERGVILEEISMVEDTPDDLSQEKCAKAFWGEDPLARPILGPAENVKSFTADDVRSFVAEHYVSENIVVAVCGNISRERAIELVYKYFDFPSRKEAHDARPMPIGVGGKIESAIKDVEQANVTFAFPSFSYVSNEVPSLAILSTALGGGMSSRLFQEIREKQGLVYSVYTFPSLYEDAGAFCLYFGTNPKKLRKAADGVRKCLSDAILSGIDEEEFFRAKQQVRGSLVMGEERCLNVLRAMAKCALFKNEPYSIDKSLSEVEAVSLSDVNGLLPRVFDFARAGVGYVGRKPSFDLEEMIK